MDRQKILRITFIFLAFMIGIALMLEITAILYYPGGNHITGDVEEVNRINTELTDLGFSFFPGRSNILGETGKFNFVYNTLTDLGRNPTPSGKPNFISMNLYRTAICIMAFFGIVYHSIIWKYFTKDKITKYLSIAGSFLGIAQAFLYIAVAYVLVHPTHNKLIGAAGTSLISAVILYTVAFFRQKNLPRINKWVFLIMLIIAFVYISLVVTGVLIHNSGGSNILYYTSQRIGHTLFNWCLKVTFIIESIGFYYYLRSKK